MSDHKSGGILPLSFLSLPSKPLSPSRRVQQRYYKQCRLYERVNECISSLNCLSSSMSPQLSSSASACVCLWGARCVCDSSQGQGSSTLQVRCVDSLRQRCVEYLCRASDRDDLSLFDSSDCGVTVVNGYCAGLEAVAIVADKISLPARAGTADLVARLPEELSARYGSPSGGVLVPGWENMRCSSGRVLGERGEYVSLVRRLHACGMVVFRRVVHVVNGLFAVKKGEDSQRLILNAKPCNGLFVDPPSFELPTPDLLANLQARSGQRLYVAKTDLADYYHRLRVPEWLVGFFAIPALTTAELGMTGELGGGRVFPCFITLPMGWSHAPLLAQMRHEHVLDTRTSLQPVDRISSASDVHVDRVRHSVYIDDVGFIGPSEVEVNKKLEEYVRVMDVECTPTKQSKTVRASADGVELTGFLIEGVTGRVGVDPHKLERLVTETMGMLRRGRCTGQQLSTVVGKWTWAALGNRFALSVFSAVYRFVACARWRSFTIWRTVSDELTVMCGLAPLLFSNLRADWMPCVVATDASSTGLGVVAQAMEPAECGRVSEQVRCGDLRALAVKRQRWRCIVSHRWKKPAHINELECRAVDTGLRWALTCRGAVGSRILFLCDSQVVVGALRKGRSGSHSLLRRVRCFAARVFALGVRPVLRWIPTDLNPADDSSRW